MFLLQWNNLACLFSRRLEKVFNFSKEDFVPKKSAQPGLYWVTFCQTPLKWYRYTLRSLFKWSMRCFLDPVHISGQQRLKMAQERVQENQSTLQKDLEDRRAGSSIHIKQEPVSNSEDEPMDTSCSSSIPNGSLNGYPSATSPDFDHTNGGSPANTASPELQDFVIKTFRKHFVITLNELKRLFNLHVASIPVGRSVFHSISDHMLQDAILLSQQCKQIMVPVSLFCMSFIGMKCTKLSQKFFGCCCARVEMANPNIWSLV